MDKKNPPKGGGFAMMDYLITKMDYLIYLSGCTIHPVLVIIRSRYGGF
jgi:hypothetical protein